MPSLSFRALLLCQIPASVIWGDPELLCTALHFSSPAPAAQAGSEDLAHVKEDKTWEWTACFGSHLKPKGVVWKEDVQEENWDCSLRRLCGGSARQNNCLWPEMFLHSSVTVSRQPRCHVPVLCRVRVAAAEATRLRVPPSPVPCCPDIGGNAGLVHCGISVCGVF